MSVEGYDSFLTADPTKEVFLRAFQHWVSWSWARLPEKVVNIVVATSVTPCTSSYICECDAENIPGSAAATSTAASTTMGALFLLDSPAGTSALSISTPDTLKPWIILSSPVDKSVPKYDDALFFSFFFFLLVFFERLSLVDDGAKNDEDDNEELLSEEELEEGSEPLDYIASRRTVVFRTCLC